MPRPKLPPEERKRRHKAAALRWYLNNPRRNHKKSVERARLVKYGVTPEAYDVMLQTQNGHCAICPCTPEENGRALAVDHDHKTGRVRGLLCLQCNRGLGMFADNPERLRSAGLYLEKQ